MMAMPLQFIWLVKKFDMNDIGCECDEDELSNSYFFKHNRWPNKMYVYVSYSYSALL